MKYDVQHGTHYEYRSIVPLAKHVLRLTPISNATQTVLATSLSIEPPPAERHEIIDAFGNRATEITIDTDHRSLSIRGRDSIIVHARANVEMERTQPWETVGCDAMASFDLGAHSPAHFVFPSRLAGPLPQISDYARSSFGAGQPVLICAMDLMRRMRQDFVYDPAATDAATPVGDAFAWRRGVCQDFAHVIISALRAVGVPAAYVSGYLATSPPSGQPRLLGADAMHAWARVWCGREHGWVDLDPTNGVVVDQGHVTVAVGRDFADVAPVGGVVISSAGHSLASWVDVAGTDESR